MTDVKSFVSLGPSRRITRGPTKRKIDKCILISGSSCSSNSCSSVVAEVTVVVVVAVVTEVTVVEIK
jgi:hypothetical protein